VPPEPRHARRCRAEAGATLVELLVALTLLLLVLLLATQLLLEATRLFAASGARAGNPATGLAAERLRDDLRAATRADGLPGHGGLVLFMPSEVAVEWRPEGRRLVRTWRHGAAIAERTELDRLTDWHWQGLGGGLVQVRVEVETAGTGFVRWVGTTRLSPPPAEREGIDVVARLRGGGGGGW